MNKKVKILFLHPNFPGQFKQLAIFFGSLDRFDTKFLCMTNFGNYIRGVDALIIKGNRGQEYMNLKKQNEFNNMLFRAESYRRAFLMLNKNSWQPDIVIGHTGWGCGMHVKEIWPKTMFIGYAEWWFEAFSEIDPGVLSNKFLGINNSSRAKLWHRNRIISFELCTADAIVAPSKWQKQQLPKALQNNCHVIPDGIDIDYFSQNKAELSRQPLLTYGTRGMEPMRCFKEFIQSLPPLFQKFPDLKVEIAGEDKICYGGLNPTKDMTWGVWAKKYLASSGFGEKVQWLGHLSYENYRKWLQRSWCHAYLSQPFVCSWSFLEAIACGNIIIASKSPPVEEYASKLKGVLLVNHNDPKEIAYFTSIAIKSATSIRKKDLLVARRDLLERISSRKSLQAWLDVAGLDPNTSC